MLEMYALLFYVMCQPFSFDLIYSITLMFKVHSHLKMKCILTSSLFLFFPVLLCFILPQIDVALALLDPATLLSLILHICSLAFLSTF
jgi:hypothetical protein